MNEKLLYILEYDGEIMEVDEQTERRQLWGDLNNAINKDYLSTSFNQDVEMFNKGNENGNDY